MKYFVCVALVLVAVTALPYELVEDDEGQQYYLMPVERSKRQTTNWQIQSPGFGVVSHSGTILDNDRHRLDGAAYAAKDLRRLDNFAPDAFGGKLDYSHKPSGSVLGVQADHAPGGGTDLKASGTWNFVNKKNAQVGLSGQYGRHYGGPGGTGKPDYGVFLGAKYDF